jgi:hypothetical protein
MDRKAEGLVIQIQMSHKATKDLVPSHGDSSDDKANLRVNSLQPEEDDVV